MAGGLRYETAFDVPGVPPRAAFDYVADPANATRWNRIAREVSSPDPPGVGRRLAVVGGLLGFSFELEMVVAVHEPPSAYRLDGRRPFPTELAMRFAAHGTGTRATVSMAAEPGGSLPVGGVLLRSGLRRQFDGDMRLLRRSLEELS